MKNQWIKWSITSVQPLNVTPYLAQMAEEHKKQDWRNCLIQMSDITSVQPLNVAPYLVQMAEEHKKQGWRVLWRPDGLVLYVQISPTRWTYMSRYICLNDDGEYVNRVWG